MENKLPQIYTDVLFSYHKLGTKEIVGKNLTQIVDSLALNYTTVYAMNITAKLIRMGLLIRDIKNSGAVQFEVTEKGLTLLLETGLIEEENVKEEVPQMNTSNKQEIKGFDFTEKDKEKAILSLLNDTLLKTVVYCQDLSVQLSTIEKEEQRIQLEKDKAELQAKLRSAQMIIDSLEEDRLRVKDSMPMIMGQLKCSIDSKLNEHYDMIAWQRELAKDELKRSLMTYIDEALEDLELNTKHNEELD